MISDPEPQSDDSDEVLLRNAGWQMTKGPRLADKLKPSRLWKHPNRNGLYTQAVALGLVKRGK